MKFLCKISTSLTRFGLNHPMVLDILENHARFLDYVQEPCNSMYLCTVQSFQQDMQKSCKMDISLECFLEGTYLPYKIIIIGILFACLHIVVAYIWYVFIYTIAPANIINEIKSASLRKIQLDICSQVHCSTN